MLGTSSAHVLLATAPITPRRVTEWLQLHPANNELASNGLKELLRKLLTGVLTDLPTDLPRYALDKLGGIEAGASEVAQAKYFSSYDCRFEDTRVALPRYVSEARVMEFFSAIVEAAIAELVGQDVEVQAHEWLKLYLDRITQAEQTQAEQ